MKPCRICALYNVDTQYRCDGYCEMQKEYRKDRANELIYSFLEELTAAMPDKEDLFGELSDKVLEEVE